MNIYVLSWQYLAEFMLEWEIFQKKVEENNKKKLYSIIPPTPPKIVSFLDNVEKYGQSQTGHRQQNNMSHLFCILNK